MSLPLSFSGARWAEHPVASARIQRIQATGLSPVAARCLALRWDGDGLPDDGWFQPTLDHLHDPLQMRNMEAALDRLRIAARRNQRIRVVTDYDVDGTTSSLILQAALRLLREDIDISYHIPNRFTEGYGFSVEAARAAAADGVDLIVTADIGVRDHEAVAVAREAGVDVLICDHHLPLGAAVPEGATVLCPPQEGCGYPNRALAACGVSVKLAQALLADHPRHDDILRSLLKLAAVGTVADMVPLNTAENRAIVSLGLQQLNHGRHNPGLSALLQVSGVQPGEIDTPELGFRIGPRINAAGRLADASLVVRLLACRDPREAQALAQQLDHLNTERRGLQDRLTRAALAQISDPPPPFVLVSGPDTEGWHRGVAGIVAARLRESTHRPAAVVSVQGPVAVGSMRSIPGLHAVRALDAAADLLLRHGGHPMAAGFTLHTADLPALRARLEEYTARALSEEELVAVHDYDARVEAEALTEGLYQELARLGPFGQGNQRPRLMIPDVRASDLAVVGKTGSTLRLRIDRPQGPLTGIWFRGAAHAEALRAQRIDLLGHLGENLWRGRRSLQFEITDARPAQREPL